MRSRRRVVEGGAVGEVDEERHPVAAVGLFDADDEGLADLGEAFDGLVDVGGAHPDALAVEGGVGAAVDDDGAAVGEGDPVAVPPDAGVHVEVAVVVAAAVGVVPEADRHGRHGVGELVDGVARLCCMNMLLHGISADGADEVPIEVRDALGSQGGKNYEMVMTNPPFGKKSSVTIVNEKGEAEKESLTIHRDDFWASTSNKQLNFLQHVFTILKQHGRAAIVVPDNVLFEGGAGETVRRELLKQADVHTLLRLPTGIFYAQGVKANVLFFDRKPAQEKAWTEKLWIYDFRTNKHFTLKENQLKRADLDDFVACYHAENRHERTESERFKCFAYDDLAKRDKVNLDIFWLKDESLEDSANLPAPDIIAAEIVEDLQAALEQFSEIASDLGGNAAEEQK